MGHKVFAIGLDGTPHSLLVKWTQEGNLPNLAKVLKTGSLVRMNSTRPDVSSVAWATFMTGMNPGKHGVFGFVDRIPDSYDIYIPNLHTLKATTLWEVLSQAGKNVVVMNVPVSYPPREVRGILVGCFLSPDLAKATYPAWVAGKLAEMGYIIDVDPWQGRESKDKFMAQLHLALEKRVEAARWFMETQPWDFFMLHIMETDRLHHFLWEHMEKHDPVYAPQFLELYQKMDALIGEIASQLSRDTALILLSDHGSCTLEKEVYLNHWLAEEGYLKFDKTPPESLTDMASATRAYIMDPARLYIHMRGREPRGSVLPGPEYHSLREEIRDKLLKLRDPETGAPIIEGVFRREEIYQGPLSARAADLVMMPHRGYDLKGSMRKATFTDKGTLVGMHTFDDAFFFVQGEKIKKERAEITDGMPTILKLMDVPTPTGLDGESLI